MKPWQIGDGRTGFLVNDYPSARRALARLAADPAFARNVAEAAAKDIEARFSVAATWRLLTAFIEHAEAGGRGLIEQPADLAADQRARLAAGMAGYASRHPLARRLATERRLYLQPWFWRLTALDAAEIVRRRLAR